MALLYIALPAFTVASFGAGAKEQADIGNGARGAEMEGAEGSPVAGPVLVGIDFSPGSEEALAWAVEAAIAFDVSLIALHVVHDPAETPGYYVRASEGKLLELERVAEGMMYEFIEAAKQRLPRLGEVRHIDTVIVTGLPETRILEVAEREGASLIAMGGQGRTALADAILGSKVERVTRLATIPVTVVKAAPQAARESSEQCARPRSQLQRPPSGS